jgi:hypothetical protein
MIGGHVIIRDDDATGGRRIVFRTPAGRTSLAGLDPMNDRVFGHVRLCVAILAILAGHREPFDKVNALRAAAKRVILRTERTPRREAFAVKKLKHEAELFKAALTSAIKYAEERGAVEFEATDSSSQKLLYVYRLLVHDKIIQPLPEDQVSESNLRHKLAIWYSRQLPKDHPLLS